MKLLLTFALAMVCLSVEAVVVQYLGIPLARMDVTVAIVAFLALRAGLLEGAFSSFMVGYLLDLMSSRPLGLYTFLAVLTFLVARLVDTLVEVRSRTRFVFFAMGADLGHRLLATLLSWLTSKDVWAAPVSLKGLPLAVLLTGATAILLYPLLKRVNASAERSEPGLLR
jgi:rod shape-determining protein MreD